jgi:hypothetical protein
MKKICRGPTCGQEIDFFENAETGRKVIVNVKPIRAWVPSLGGEGRVLSTKVYIDHHATCPDVKLFAKKPEAKPESPTL